jgi:cell division initiation protein
MSRITVVDIQHKSFKKQLQGYDRGEVDAFLDELIETIEDDATARAALEAEIADLRERISHFKAMEQSLQHTLVLAQRTADEVKAAAHKEADLIKQEARMQVEREIAALSDRVVEVRREHQRAVDTAELAKSEIRSLLRSHLALLDRLPASPQPGPAALPLGAETLELAEPKSADAPAGPRAAEPQAPLLVRNGITHTLVK